MLYVPSVRTSERFEYTLAWPKQFPTPIPSACTSCGLRLHVLVPLFRAVLATVCLFRARELALALDSGPERVTLVIYNGESGGYLCGIFRLFHREFSYESTNSGSHVFRGDATSFHEWEFRTKSKVMGKADKEYKDVVSVTTEGLRPDAFVVVELTHSSLR